MCLQIRQTATCDNWWSRKRNTRHLLVPETSVRPSTRAERCDLQIYNARSACHVLPDMTKVRSFLILVFFLLLSACGGDALEPTNTTQQAMRASVSQVETFAKVRSDYVITASADGYVVTDIGGQSTPRVVRKSAILRFANISITMDADGRHGQVYRLYQAAFRRRPDIEGLSFWIGASARGYQLDQIAQQFVRSGEFKLQHGKVPVASILIDSFYINVLGRYGEPAGNEYWKSQLATVTDATVASVLLGFSDSKENKERTAADISQGLAFLEADVVYVQPLTSTQTRLVMEGDRGVMQLEGQKLSLDSTNARFRLTESYNRYVGFSIEGDDGVNISFSSGEMHALVPQHYTAGASISIGSLSCGGDGAFTVHRVERLNGEPVLFDASFEIPCGRTGAMQRGRLTWNKHDTTRAMPPGLVPANYWSPSSALTPLSGSYLYLHIPAGHYMSATGAVLLTPARGGLSVSNRANLLAASASADGVRWDLDFQGMHDLAQFLPGHYPGLRRYQFHNPAKGGFTLSRAEGGIGKSCDAQADSVVVDSVEYVKGHLRSIDLRFEMRCGVSGKLHWVNEQVSQVDGLWQAAPGDTPATGSYVFLQGERKEYITAGQQWLATRADAELHVGVIDGRLNVKVDGQARWEGTFEGFHNTIQLRPGYYRVPADGKMTWSGEGRGCGSDGWFIVDDASYSGGELKALDLRFELRCQPHAQAMHGKIHWVADEFYAVPGPQPVPAGLWTPPAGSIPAVDTYAYFEGGAGSYIAAGKSYLVTPQTSTFRATIGNGLFSLFTFGKDISTTPSWSAAVQTMSAHPKFQKGFYGNVRRRFNPIVGSVDIGGDARGCNMGYGWYVVDDVAYSGDTLMMIELRMEFRCDEYWGTDRDPVYGKVRWIRPPG